MRAPRLVAVLAAAALATGGATTALAAVSPPAVATAAALALPTSWPAVPVGERLAPWLAQELAKGGSAPLRVMISGENLAAASSAATASGLTVQQHWDEVGVVVAIGTPAAVHSVVSRPGVTYVEGDEPLAYTLNSAHAATRSDQALTAFTAPDGSRVDGRGVTVAVIDSGIDGTHPMFNRDGRSKVLRNLENSCTSVNGPSDVCYQQEPTNDTDTNSGGGHGTHVAGILAGYEVRTTNPAGVELRGAAPEANLIGLSVGAALSLINANSAMNWVVEHQRKPCAASGSAQNGDLDPTCPPIRVTNHSYGPLNTSGQDNTFSESSATVRLQRSLISKGVVPVWAAGNDGGDGSVALTNPPGMDPTPGVLMVASYNDAQRGSRDNSLSGFSSRGKKGTPDSYPDISAPGHGITSACRSTLPVCQGSPSYDGGNYQTISGTSMSTPYVAGVVAQLVQAAESAITPAEIEDVLEDTAHPFTAGGAYETDPRNVDSRTSFDKGHGLVDVTAALSRLRSPAGSPTASPSSTGSPADGAGLPPSGSAGPTASPSPASSRSPSPSASALPSASAPATPSPEGAGPSTDGRVAALDTPVRVLDSRNGTGTSRGLKRGDVVVDLSDQLPAGAAAAVLNVTVTNPDAPGFVVAHPHGSSTPPTSNVNFRARQTQANEVIVGVSGARRVVLRVDSASAHLVADLVGYVTTADTPDAGRLAPLPSPVRVLDTRTQAGPRVSGEVPVEVASRVPADARAVLLNVTLTGPDRRGFAVVFPTGSQRPGTSNVNVEPGQTQANEVLARIGRNGRVSVFVDSTAAAVIVDLVGYVAESGEHVRSYVPLPEPLRAADSRVGHGMSAGRVSGDVSLRMPAGVPADATAVLLNVTAAGASRPGFVTVFPTGTSRPGTSNVNFGTGSVQANEVLTPVGTDRRVALHVGGSGAPQSHLVVDVVGYLVPPDGR